MDKLQIADNTYQLSVNIENLLFEGVWEMPEGVSLNSYIIKGDKTAIVDGFCGWDGVPETLFQLFQDMGITAEQVEYLIVNHMEPDHSGWIEAFRKLNPNFTVLCTDKAKALLDTFYGHTENVTVVKDGDTLDLGQGHVLKFISIPNVHWPDTMATFDEKTGVLFSCDAFGAFGKLGTAKYAEDISEEEMKVVERETIRYYSNILASFTMAVKKAVSKCRELPVRILAPGHGLMWREPEKIIDLYDHLADYQKGIAREEILFLWSSMYGMTEKAVRYVESVLAKEQIKVTVLNVPEASWGTILGAAWTATGVILAMPTYEYKMFPPMAAALEELGRKRVLGRKAFRFGSYGWSGGAQKELDEIMTRLTMNWEFLEPVEFAGSPRKEDFALLEQRVKELIQVVKETAAK